MEYLIRFAQCHETFRLPELEALSSHEDVGLEVVSYEPASPFCTVRLIDRPTRISSPTLSSSPPLQPQLQPPSSLQKDPSTLAESFISRSILARGIYELWGVGPDYASLHTDVKTRSKHLWHLHQHDTFKFSIDAFYGKRSNAQQRAIIESFSYLGFKGKVTMKNPKAEFVIFEEWEFSDGRELLQPTPSATPVASTDHTADGVSGGHIPTNAEPKRIFLGRYIGGTRRQLADKHDLKKRPYISTTSMDAELALITANLALAGPGKLFMDPFVGTGGFMVAASELGAVSLGSDIDGRSFRGKGSGLKKGVGANFKKYGLEKSFGDCLTCDMTNTPFRVSGYTHAHNARDGAAKRRRKMAAEESGRWLDGIISDPPYGVREGIKVLGMKVLVRPSVAAKAAAAEVTPQPVHQQSEQMPSAVVSDATTNGETSSTHDRLPSSTLIATFKGTSISTQDPSAPVPPEQSVTVKDHTKPYMIDGVPAHTRAGYIAPKKPYSFTLMLADILQFASITLVDGGRLAFWMPCADTIPDADINDDTNNSKETRTDTATAVVSFDIPTHPDMKLLHVCVQPFNRWSRRLLVYERIPGPTSIHPSGRDEHTNAPQSRSFDLLNGTKDQKSQPPTTTDAVLEDKNTISQMYSQEHTSASSPSTPARSLNIDFSSAATASASTGTDIGASTGTSTHTRHTADDLNPFRRMYFQGFRKP